MIDLKPAGRQLNAVVAAIGDDELTHPTPCTEYSVADLLGHVDEGVRAFAAAAGADADAEPLAFTGNWRETLAARVELTCTAWDDPAAWRGESAFGDLAFPNETWGRIALTELVVHGWDLARATGQPFELPAATLQPVYDHLAVQSAAPPVPGMWGAPVPVPDDAPLLDRLLGLGGRRP